MLPSFGRRQERYLTFHRESLLAQCPPPRTSARRPEHPKLSPMPTLVHQCFRASSTSSALTIRAHPHAGICWPWGAHTPLHSSSDCAASGRPSPPSRPWHGVLHGWRHISARRTCCGALSPTGRPARTRALLHAPALCAICVCSRPARAAAPAAMPASGESGSIAGENFMAASEVTRKACGPSWVGRGRGRGAPPMY